MIISANKEDNKIVSEKEIETSVENNGDKKVSSEDSIIPKVRKWSAEEPNLYILLLTLKKKSDQSILEIISFRVGFRREEITNIKFDDKSYPVLLFNGKPVIYKGVNIHELDEKTGHYVIDEIRLKDIEFLKKHNFNAIRFCHYPNCRRLYELCECNIKSHGIGYECNIE